MSNFGPSDKLPVAANLDFAQSIIQSHIKQKGNTLFCQSIFSKIQRKPSSGIDNLRFWNFATCLFKTLPIQNRASTGSAMAKTSPIQFEGSEVLRKADISSSIGNRLFAGGLTGGSGTVPYMPLPYSAVNATGSVLSPELSRAAASSIAFTGVLQNAQQSVNQNLLPTRQDRRSFANTLMARSNSEPHTIGEKDYMTEPIAGELLQRKAAGFGTVTKENLVQSDAKSNGFFGPEYGNSVRPKSPLNFFIKQDNVLFRRESKTLTRTFAKGEGSVSGVPFAEGGIERHESPQIKAYAIYPESARAIRKLAGIGGIFARVLGKEFRSLEPYRRNIMNYHLSLASVSNPTFPFDAVRRTKQDNVLFSSQRTKAKAQTLLNGETGNSFPRGESSKSFSEVASAAVLEKRSFPGIPTKIEHNEFLHTNDSIRIPAISKLVSSVDKPSQNQQKGVQANTSNSVVRGLSSGSSKHAESVIGTFLPLGSANVTRILRRHKDMPYIQLHNDSSANYMAAKLNAEAFTVGHDIFFASGKLNLGTAEGIALLGHEITHVDQQDRGDIGASQYEVLENEALANERTILSLPAKISRKIAGFDNETPELIHVSRSSTLDSPMAQELCSSPVDNKTSSEMPAHIEPSANTISERPNIDSIAEQVYEIIERRLRREKDRRGYF